MAIKVEENEARAKIEALANKLGYSTASFFPGRGGSCSKDKYVIAFKIDNGDSPLDLWVTLMTCESEEGEYICAMEDLLFEDNYWSHAIEKMEDVVKHRCKIKLQFKPVLNPNETIDEALIRLDLNCLEK